MLEITGVLSANKSLTHWEKQIFKTELDKLPQNQVVWQAGFVKDLWTLQMVKNSIIALLIRKVETDN